MIIFNINKILRERHLSITELSQRTALSEKRLNGFASGNIQAIPVNMLNRVCEELDCTPGELLDYKSPDY